MRGNRRVVRHQDDCESVLVVELTEEIENLLSRLRVEVAGRLVSDQKGTAVDERRAIATRCCSPPESRAGS